MSECEICGKKINGGPGSHPPSWCRDELRSKLESANASAMEAARQLECALLQVRELEKIKRAASRWADAYGAIDSKFQGVQVERDLLLTLAGCAEKRVGEPDSCSTVGANCSQFALPDTHSPTCQYFVEKRVDDSCGRPLGNSETCVLIPQHGGPCSRFRGIGKEHRS